MATFSLLIVFPFLMAYAAARDLLTMLIPNTVSVALTGAFAVFALGTGLGWADVAGHVGAGASTLAITFTLFAFGFIGGEMPSSPPRRPCGSASITSSNT